MIRVRPRVVVIAGHDSSGGAGVDADREALQAQGVRFEAVVTALTEQDATRFHSLGARPVEEWEAEGRARLGDGPLAAVKVGLLPGAEAVLALERLLEAAPPEVPVVVDPVLGSSSGATFLDEEGRRALLERIVPRGVILTPNLPEAAALTVRDPEALASVPTEALFAAGELLERGAAGVVLKGGHGADPAQVRDLVVERGRPPAWVIQARVPGGGMHGSGCRHASALAGRLAQGDGLEDAARAAAAWLAERLEAAGRASGPR